MQKKKRNRLAVQIFVCNFATNEYNELRNKAN